jgi:hypothetical protein
LNRPASCVLDGGGVSGQPILYYTFSLFR